MLTFAPLPAASIMTPMMLLALIRRAPFVIQISHLNLPASWVSLADARACRPSLLMISISWVSMLYSVHAFVAIGQGAQQHGQIDPGQAFDAAGIEQFLGKVGRRGAEDVGQHQHAPAAVDQLQHLA